MVILALVGVSLVIALADVLGYRGRKAART
jgi:hypothetical protein